MKVEESLIQALKETDKNNRIQAAMDLGTIGGNDSLPALVDALATEPDFLVRESITWALGTSSKSLAKIPQTIKPILA